MAKIDEPAPGVSAEGEDTGAAAAEDLSVPPELVSGSVSEYLRMSLARIRGGDTGVLPVIAGLLLVSIIFQSQNAHFLTAANLVNLLVQAALISMLAMGEVYALLLGEIDLSIGFVAGLGGVVLAEALKPNGLDWPWWAAIAALLGVCAPIGLSKGPSSRGSACPRSLSPWPACCSGRGSC
jgi:D-xylose transport system permease protein